MAGLRLLSHNAMVQQIVEGGQAVGDLVRC